MENYLKRLDKKRRLFIDNIAREADQQRFSAYVIGGVVRDLLLSRTNIDLDVVVEGDAIILAKALSRKWRAELTPYPAFGTATLRLNNRQTIDLASARRETYPYPGALPVVRMGGAIKEDLFRRDFTINAMAIGINGENQGRLIDYYGGYNDLKSKKIRVLHDGSFRDDPTRLLRAVRFEQRFGFRLEAKTLNLVKTAISKNYGRSVKLPRYFAEFQKIFSEASPSKVLARLAQLSGLDFLQSGFKFQSASFKHIEERIKHLQKKNIYRDIPWAPIYRLALFDQLDKRRRKYLSTMIGLTKKEAQEVAGLKGLGNIATRLSRTRLRPSEVYAILCPLPMNVIYYLRVKANQRIVHRAIDRFLDQWSKVKLQITGIDVKRFGVKEGRKVGLLLKQLLCIKIDKALSGKKEEMKALQNLIQLSVEV